MINKGSKNIERQRRHARLRTKINGTASCPRLSVFRSNKHIACQLIDDEKGVTLASCSSVNLKLENGGNIEASKAVGSEIAKLALEKNIDTIVFDRGGYNYHGRIKALAEAAREAGLKF
jgi:large subunit ribosomal protein L18